MEKYPTLYSERLILQPMTLADAPAVQQLFPHWEVVRYLNALVPWPYPDDGALNYLRDIALPAQWQGQGLMSEASRVVAHYWFEVLERPLMRVPKAAANLASRRISEREGMRLIRSEERTFVSGRLPCDLWEITREEWRRNQSPDACISPE